ncbi:glycoside hydrolase family 3 N-terminal domain-containing protein [Aquimarina sp. M1]
MHTKYIYLFLILLLFLNVSIYSQNDRLLSAKEVENLISKMTLEEKVGQMAQITLDVITQGKNETESDEPLSLNIDLVRKAVVDYKIGSILNTANNRARSIEKWREVIATIQNIATTETRLKIPVLYGIDAIHGATYTAGATFFPQQIGMAASRNRDLVKQAASITAYETRASGIPWNFSPALDMGRDPRFPRIWEGFGEDVFLTTEMGVQMIKGYEGDTNDVSDKYKVASCLKHFLGYTVAKSGKDRTPSVLSDLDLREIHIPPFKAAIDAGSHSVMISSGIINGTPVHASKKIITDLLKTELGFKGLVVTDWADIENLHKRDRVAKDMKEAVKLAVNAGIDMSMIPYNFKFCDYLIELVKEGAVSQDRIDDAVFRIVSIKNDLGLFKKPLIDLEEFPKFGSQEHQKLAYDLAQESITLLKNKNETLPLNKELKVLVTGPNSSSMRTLNGGWSYSWQGEKVEEFAGSYNTILEAITNEISKENVVYKEGVSYNHKGKYWEEENLQISATVAAAANVDVIILCLGENSYTEKPGDLHDLRLSQNQIDLAKALAKTGKPMILVLNEGRPRLIREIEPLMAGILQIYLPGNYGADALADIIFGDKNPSGKLPYTYPLYPNTLLNYDYKPSENQKKLEGVYDYESEFAVQYPFGFGLSYTTFQYSELKTNKIDYQPDEDMIISVNVKNIGKITGDEVVQLYVSDVYASITPDNKRLRGFQKVKLKPGEQKTVTFTLKPKQLSFINATLERVVEKGAFQIQIHDLSKTIVQTEDQKF